MFNFFDFEYLRNSLTYRIRVFPERSVNGFRKELGMLLNCVAVRKQNSAFMHQNYVSL